MARRRGAVGGGIVVNVVVCGEVVGEERNRERAVEVEKGIGVIGARVVRLRREVDRIFNGVCDVLGRHRAVGRFEQLVESCFQILLRLHWKKPEGM